MDASNDVQENGFRDCFPKMRDSQNFFALKINARNNFYADRFLIVLYVYITHPFTPHYFVILSTYTSELLVFNKLNLICITRSFCSIKKFFLKQNLSFKMDFHVWFLHFPNRHQVASSILPWIEHSLKCILFPYKETKLLEDIVAPLSALRTFSSKTFCTSTQIFKIFRIKKKACDHLPCDLLQRWLQKKC